MTIIAEYMEIANRIAACTEIPLVDEAYFPTLEMNPDRAAQFGVIVLADGSVGLTYLYLDPSLLDEDRSYLNHLEGKDPLELAQHFGGDSGWQTAVALGGTTVQDTTTFLRSCRNDERWGNASQKYHIHRKDYPGFETLLAQLG